MVALDILSDGFFAAVAGIGFGAISDPPLFRGRYCYRFFICRFGNRFW